jgi:hypothetical protein
VQPASVQTQVLYLQECRQTNRLLVQLAWRAPRVRPDSLAPQGPRMGHRRLVARRELPEPERLELAPQGPRMGHRQLVARRELPEPERLELAPQGPRMGHRRLVARQELPEPVRLELAQRELRRMDRQLVLERLERQVLEPQVLLAHRMDRQLQGARRAWLVPLLEHRQRDRQLAASVWLVERGLPELVLQVLELVPQVLEPVRPVERVPPVWRVPVRQVPVRVPLAWGQLVSDLRPTSVRRLAWAGRRAVVGVV